jgi:hypothetical protein
MAFPRRMAALLRPLNPLVLPLTRRVPPLAVLHHKGRRSGRSYDTPVPALASLEMRAVGIDEFLLFDVAPLDDRR